LSWGKTAVPGKNENCGTGKSWWKNCRSQITLLGKRKYTTFGDRKPRTTAKTLSRFASWTDLKGTYCRGRNVGKNRKTLPSLTQDDARTWQNRRPLRKSFAASPREKDPTGALRRIWRSRKQHAGRHRRGGEHVR